MKDNIFFELYIFLYLSIILFAHIYMISIMPNTNNLDSVVWFQVFLSNTNNFQTDLFEGF